MKVKSTAFYASVVLNVLLLAFLAAPQARDRFAFGQVSSSVGAFAAASSQSSSSRDAFWLADRVSGTLVAYDYDTTRDEMPLAWAQRRSLREDLQQRNLGPLMIVPMRTTSNRSAVMVIDTDSERMAVYTYDPQDRAIVPIQRNDLREDLGKIQVQEPAM